MLRTEYHYVSDDVNFIAFKAVMHFSWINLAIPFTATVEIPTIEFAMIAIHLSPVSGAMLLRYGVLALKFVNNILHNITPFTYCFH